jgi:hypothetical protein
VALLSCVVPVVAACSTGPTFPGGLQNTGHGSPPVGGTNGTDTDEDASLGTPDAAVCAAPSLTSVGPCEASKPSEAPTPIGGTVLSGTYRLTAVNLYEGTDASAASSACDIRYELVISGNGSSGSIALAYEVFPEYPLETESLVTTATGAFSTSGNAFTEVFSCQAFNNGAVSATTAYAAYTAQGGELRLYGAPFSTSVGSLSLSTEYVFTQE